MGDISMSSASCAVDLFDAAHKRIAVLALGISAVIDVARYVDAGAEGTLRVSHDFSCNYDLVFTGAHLKVFLAKQYPARLSRDEMDAIHDDQEYTVSSFDMS